MYALVRLALIVLLQTAPEYSGPRRPPDPVRTMEAPDEDSLPAAPGAGHFVRVSDLSGLPADSLARAGFLDGFRSAFGESRFATEQVAKKTGAVKRGEALSNRFRLIDGSGEAKGAWRVRVSLAWTRAPAPAGDSLGAAAGLQARVEFQVVPPSRDDPETGPPGWRETLLFPAGHRIDAAYYQHAGRQVGLLVIEALHKTDGELDDDQRVVLEDAVRGSPAAPR